VRGNLGTLVPPHPHAENLPYSKWANVSLDVKQFRINLCECRRIAYRLKMSEIASMELLPQ